MEKKSENLLSCGKEMKLIKGLDYSDKLLRPIIGVSIPCCFKKKLDIQRIRFFRESYTICFSQSKINNNIPKVFDFEESSQVYFNLIRFHVLQMNLSLSMMDFASSSLMNACHANQKGLLNQIINYTISLGINYVSERENSYWRRNGILNSLPYSDMTETRYYFVYFVLNLVNQLRAYPLSNELIEEFYCLKKFLILIQEHLPYLFRKTSVRGFHFYLRLTLKAVDQMMENAAYRLSRRSLKELLYELASMLSDLNESIIRFLLCCVSDIEFNSVLTLHGIKHSPEMFDPRLIESSFFKLIRIVMSSDDLSEDYHEQIKKIILSKSLSKFFDKATLDNIKKCYINSVIILFRLKDRFESFEEIGDTIIKFGELEFIRNTDLQKILEVNIKTLSSLCSSLIENISYISSRNDQLLSSLTRIEGGFQVNVISSNKFLIKIISQVNSLEKKISDLRVVIDRLSLTEEPDVDSVSSSLIKKSLNDFQKDLQYGAYDSCQTQNLFHHFAESFPLRLQFKLQNVLESYVNPHSQTKVFYPMINDRLKISEFDQMMRRYIFITRDFINFLSMVDKIHQLTRDLHFLIIQDDGNSTITFHKEKKSSELMQELKESLSRCHFSDMNLIKFSDVSEVCDKVERERSKLHLAIVKVLSPSYQSKKSHCHGTGGKPIDLFLSFKNQLFPHEDLIKKKLASIMKRLVIDRNQNIIHYFDNLFKKKIDSKSKKNLSYDLEFFVRTASALSVTNDRRQLRQEILNLYSLLLNRNYILACFSGESVTGSSGLVKVPRNIAKILKACNPAFFSGSGYDELNSARQSVFQTAREAAQKPPCYFMFFSPRDKSTQYLYDHLATYAR